MARRLGAAELMLNTAYEFDGERPLPPDPARVAAHDDTSLYFRCADMDAAYEELRRKGAAATAPTGANKSGLDFSLDAALECV